MSDKPRSIEIQVELPADKEAVWKALTVAEQIKGWFSLDAKVEPGEGGKIWLMWPGVSGESRIEVWEPGRHLRTREAAAEEGSPRAGRPLLAVDYYLESRGEASTVLRLVHSGFGASADWDDEYDDTKNGWGTFLRNLQHYLGRHRGKRARQEMIPLPAVGSREETWRRLIGPSGLSREDALAAVREGQRVTLHTARGDVLDATVDLLAAPRALGLVLENAGGALFRLNVEHVAGQLMAWCALLTYGLSDAEVDALRARWEALLTAALSDQPVRPAPTRPEVGA